MTKVIAVTGASSGIGEATALRLARAGHQLVLGARREDRLADLAARIGDRAVFLRTDVRRRGDMAALVALAQERFGRLDVLVGNAGIGIVAPLDDLGVEGWEDMIDVNIKGFLYGVAAALPVFRAQGTGHFVTTLSTAGLKVVPGMAVYAGTKNAVRTMSEGLRQEAGAGLRVTTVSPGVTATDFVSSSIAAPEVRASYEAMAISPDAIARAVEFAIDQPADVDVNEIVVRPTAQG
ncbi:SDR family oxidoreductase [Winogradskya humida]|uniref:Oxidoreductase n=1 Tax=Winogradskya humida TaxID=113566 RepID=A0ABQ3ZZ89_9ACTN|nr:SDR family oxidoreductase [Actinoplanes humidus]GIE23899.1 oxidoreductase [Actinoplanes humidus]